MDFDVPPAGDNSLKDITDGSLNKKTEASNVAREKGWVAPESYDYAKYTFDPLKKPEDQKNVAEDAPTWAANAAKYEWNDAYGDVGPANAQLEEMLFRSEFINRAGFKLEK